MISPLASLQLNVWHIQGWSLFGTLAFTLPIQLIGDFKLTNIQVIHLLRYRRLYSVSRLVSTSTKGVVRESTNLFSIKSRINVNIWFRCEINQSLNLRGTWFTNSLLKSVKQMLNRSDVDVYDEIVSCILSSGTGILGSMLAVVKKEIWPNWTQ